MWRADPGLVQRVHASEKLPHKELDMRIVQRLVRLYHVLEVHLHELCHQIQISPFGQVTSRWAQDFFQADKICVWMHLKVLQDRQLAQAAT